MIFLIMKKVKHAILFLFFVISFSTDVFAQFTRISPSIDLPSGSEGLYGNGISLFDFSGDGVDDLSVATNGNGVHTYINNNSFFEEVFLLEWIAGDIKQVIWVDFDNDDDSDFFCTIEEGSARLYKNDGAGIFTNVSGDLNLPFLNARSYGAAWGDYDNDGWLDVYIANYEYILPGANTNWLLHNNGDGSFTEVSALLGVANNWKASFQPVWIDLNHDHLLDLFIINDRYHGNNFYLNNGTSFDDATALYNLGQAMESMSNSWSDMDNDLDFDLYISNTSQGNALLRNDDSIFNDIATSSGVSVNSICWNAIWLDFDHNGLEDLHVSTNSPFIDGNQNKLFRRTNNGDFFALSIQGDNKSALASAKGDINQDGYWDYIELEQFPASMGVFQNTGGDNRWLKIALKGTVSNRDGVGAVIRYFIGSAENIRHTFCGEGFLSQDSGVEILSLKDALLVDSLFIEWPSGWVDRYVAVAANQTLLSTEGETFSAHITNVSGHDLCPGDSLVLSANMASQMLWSDGTELSSIIIHASGNYSVTLINDWNFSATDNIIIHDAALPIFEVTAIHPSCSDVLDGSIEIMINEQEVNVIQWENFGNGFSLHNLPGGAFFFNIIDTNNCIQSAAVSLFAPDPINANFTASNACFGESTLTELTITGGTGIYHTSWKEIFPAMLFAGNYSMTITDENNCAANFNFIITENDQLVAEVIVNAVSDVNDGSIILNVTGGAPPYSFLWSDGSTDQQLTMVSKGIYACVITDADGCILSLDAIMVNLSIHQSTRSFNVFPIPFSNVLNVTSFIPSEICVIDAAGRVVYVSPVIALNHSMATDHFEHGFYIVRCNGSSFKIIK